MNLFRFGTIGLFCLGLVACDEVAKVNPDGNDGDIVWVGNGLRLQSSHGVLVDVEDLQYGRQSLILTVDHFLPLVMSVESMTSVPVKFGWATAELEQGPALQLELLDRRSECSHYISQEGELICSEILESLPIKSGSLPVGLSDAGILYVDLFDSLHHYSAKAEDQILATHADSFFASSGGKIFVRYKDESYACIHRSDSGFASCELDLQSFVHMSRLPSGEILAVSFREEPESSGVYRLEEAESFGFNLVSNFEEGWKWIGRAEDGESLKFSTKEEEEVLVRLKPEGYEVLELHKPEVNTVKTQASREYAVLETQTEEELSFQLCRTTSEADEVSLPVSKCASLRRTDEYTFKEVLLHYPEDLERPQLVAVSELSSSHPELARYRLSIFEVFVGDSSSPYLVQVSERDVHSSLGSLRSFDLRKPAEPKTESPD